MKYLLALLAAVAVLAGCSKSVNEFKIDLGSHKAFRSGVYGEIVVNGRIVFRETVWMGKRYSNLIERNKITVFSESEAK